MDIGVGLPVMVPGAGPARAVEWARSAEDHGFAGVAVLDRVVSGNPEPLVTLAAVAAVTSRVRLATTVLIGPLRGDGTLLAKQAATLHALTGGRLVLGVAAGGREDDYLATGVPFATRGCHLDEMLARMRQVWQASAAPGSPAGPVGPGSPGGGPTLIVGGHSRAAVRRAALYADGWIAGAGSAEPYEKRVRRFTDAWREAGRTSRPRLLALVYYALGKDAGEHARAYADACYGGLGGYAARVAAGVATTEDQVRAAAREHAEAGCDELLFFPCSATSDQLDRLADVLDPGGRAEG